MQKVNVPRHDESVKRSWVKLKRMGRYLLRKERMVTRFDCEEKPDDLKVFADTDFAGCLKSRKATSGSMIMNADLT